MIYYKQKLPALCNANVIVSNARSLEVFFAEKLLKIYFAALTTTLQRKINVH